MWNEVTNKTIDIDRNGRRFEMELFVPDDQEESADWSKWKKNMPGKKCQSDHWHTTVHNKFDVFSRREGE